MISEAEDANSHRSKRELVALFLFWIALAIVMALLAREDLSVPGLYYDEALIAGALLAFDPTYFFLSVLDWGAAVPSFVCRCACLYFAVRWNQQRKLRDAFFLGLFAGLGIFNKADFAVFLMALGLAALFFY